METEMLKVVAGGGAAVAVLFGMILGIGLLKFGMTVWQKDRERDAAERKADRETFEAAIKELTAAGRQSQAEYQAQIKSVVNDHMALTRETVTMIKSLETTIVRHGDLIVDLCDRVEQIEPRPPGGGKG